MRVSRAAAITQRTLSVLAEPRVPTILLEHATQAPEERRPLARGDEPLVQEIQQLFAALTAGLRHGGQWRRRCDW